MAEKFGVSRIPLREALSILADQGLVEHHPKSSGSAGGGMVCRSSIRVMRSAASKLKASR